MKTGRDGELEDKEREGGVAVQTPPWGGLRKKRKYLSQEGGVLTAGGKKVEGVLTEADENGFRVEVSEMLRKEGDKRKRLYVEPVRFTYDEIKYTKYIINFK